MHRGSVGVERAGTAERRSRMEIVQRHRFLLEAIAIIVITGIIGILIAFSQSLFVLPRETNAPVVINEVYPALLTDEPRTHQWVEVYNRTRNWQTLSGWSVEMAGGTVLLPEIVLPSQGFAIIAASEGQFLADYPEFPGFVTAPLGEWPGLDLQNDFLVLRDASGSAVDTVNWGVVSTGAGGVSLWEGPSFLPGAPWQGKWDYSLERRPLGMDRDDPRDFIRQPYPSPSTVNVPSSTVADQLLFIDWTNVASFAGGILLWIAFVYIALIARRFEALTQQRILWWLMLIFPSGILVYNLVQAYGFLTRGAMTIPEQQVSFLILLGSALLCTGFVFLFRQRAMRILEG